MPYKKNEKPQFFMMLLSMFRRYENTAYQHRRGYLEEEAWEGLRGNMRAIAERPGFEWFWGRAKSGFSDSFVTEVEKLKAQAKQ